eukprot:TRINITY_DN8786_c0_g3_i1.p1 TRINITY_DN8786_c0_g3~~TRINITY_DN8786_c0_g3_i1.p1  ORF type:complete len:141 (-),score=23.94 TRINITY_DN8786_c0_g3_i1:164-586(-)
MLIKYSVDKGASIDEKDLMGRTPLHYAAVNNNVKSATFLLQSGASINSKNIAGETPLMKAAEKNHKEVLQILLSQGCDVVAESKSGKTARCLITSPALRNYFDSLTLRIDQKLLMLYLSGKVAPFNKLAGMRMRRLCNYI